jgi:two-component system, OmpR family, sensor histidine kinase ChvG
MKELAEPRLGGDRLRADEQPALSPRSRPRPSEIVELKAPRPDEHVGEARPRRRVSALTRRILVLNILALAIPIGGILYLDQYRDSLVETKLEAMRTEGELFAAALAETGVVAGTLGDERLMPEIARLTIRRMIDVSANRARLFDQDGTLIADSKRLGTAGQVEMELLAPPETESLGARLVNGAYDYVTRVIPGGKKYLPYHENKPAQAADYLESQIALSGDVGKAVYSDGGNGLILNVAVPVQRYRRVLGALLLTGASTDIDGAVRNVRFEILRIFAAALGVTILLSVFLARTIARPIYRLADAAEIVRSGHGRQIDIPDFSRRRDEIGDLSGSLRDMTAALWQRMDAIERFAADVAHEIKNPLTSLRSAVETVARLEDPQQQKKLMSIILDDVERLNRLISDISDASRLDAELSRAETAPVDIANMLSALGDLHEATADGDSPRLQLDIAPHQNLTVRGIEDRLVQVWRNLISNAVSFSPPRGLIRVTAMREGRRVRVSVADEGPGIPPGKLTAIFDRFYSERPTGEKFGTHSGLGLSISKQIVEAHGGRIVAENRMDESGHILGALFTVTLPAAN